MSTATTTPTLKSLPRNIGRESSNARSRTDRLEPYRLSVTSSNRLYLVPDGERQVILKVFTESPKPMPKWLGVLLPQSDESSFRRRSAQERCRHERQSIEHWQRCGRSVPAVLSNRHSADLASDRILALEWIDSPSLQSLLQNNELDDVQRMQVVEKTLSEMADRHRLAIVTNDPMLAHLDANTGNVLIANDRVYRIDFESVRERGVVMELLACEVVKLCRWIARDWNPARISDITDRIVACYSTIPQVLQMAVSLTADRPFSWWHRLRDQRKKRKTPNDVTKYDVVDAIAHSLCVGTLS